MEKVIYAAIVLSQYRRSSNPCGQIYVNKYVNGECLNTAAAVTHVVLRLKTVKKQEKSLNTAAAVTHVVITDANTVADNFFKSQYRRSSNPCGLNGLKWHRHLLRSQYRRSSNPCGPQKPW